MLNICWNDVPFASTLPQIIILVKNKAMVPTSGRDNYNLQTLELIHG